MFVLGPLFLSLIQKYAVLRVRRGKKGTSLISLCWDHNFRSFCL
uniref:Uncharacterized protein n=1 Tax=Arundo donax TaxID=35708 RepID=A0A0A9H2F1_ARUDO